MGHMEQRPPLIPICEQPGYVEAFKRYLVEDALIVIATRMLEDPAAIATMERLGVHSRLVQLMQAVLHWRANPETEAEAEMREAIRKLPIAQRPEPFNAIKPQRQGPHTS